MAKGGWYGDSWGHSVAALKRARKPRFHKIKYSEYPRYYDEVNNLQITVQPTWALGRRKGEWEIVLFDLNKGIGGVGLGYTKTKREAVRRAESIIRTRYHSYIS